MVLDMAFHAKKQISPKWAILPKSCVFYEKPINLVKIMIFDDFKHFARKGMPEPLVFLRENLCSVHPMKCMAIHTKACISWKIMK